MEVCVTLFTFRNQTCELLSFFLTLKFYENFYIFFLQIEMTSFTEIICFILPQFLLCLVDYAY